MLPEIWLTVQNRASTNVKYFYILVEPASSFNRMNLLLKL